MEDNKIADDQITASSQWLESSKYHGPDNARLNRPAQSGSIGAWCTGWPDLHQWIQVDLMLPTWVTGVMIQGRQDHPQWVTEYKVEYSSDGQNWTYVQSRKELHEGKVS